MKKLPLALILTILFFSSMTTVAVGQQAQNGQTSNTTNSNQPTVTNNQSDTANQIQTQTQTQNANQGAETQQQISQEVQTKLNETLSTYSAGNASAKQSLANNNIAATNMVKLAAAVQTQNAALASQIQNAAKSQIQTTEKISQNIDKASSQNAIAKFFTGPNYKMIKETNQLMEQNRLRIKELNQIKTQLQNSSKATELQNQINLLETQNTVLQDQIDQLSSGVFLLGWLFKLING